MEMFIGKHQRTVKPDKSSTPTSALDHGSCFVPAALRYRLSWACSGTALRDGLQGFKLSCHHQFVEQGFATLGYPWRGFAKGSQGKTTLL